MMDHSEIQCSINDKRCGKCCEKGHDSKSCSKHFSKFFCVNCEIYGHSAFSKVHCPVLKEIEEKVSADEMRRLRKELGRNESPKSTDPAAKSYSSTLRSPNEYQNDFKILHSEMKDIKRTNKQIQEQLAESNNHTSLLKEIKGLFDHTEKKRKIETGNLVNSSIKRFRKEFLKELDHRWLCQKHELISLLKNHGVANDVQAHMPGFEDFDKKFEEFFKEEEIFDSDDEINDDVNDEDRMNCESNQTNTISANKVSHGTPQSASHQLSSGPSHNFTTNPTQ
jgi:hypothetical protein